ncbi:hypothetical protein RJT34_04299 [Clitoria ternatea]|uniref:Uncharacterized protein n=1 Tax=Clitoria ternatea TaxID=43366 RepID=A0AAN9KMC7_CLITE
MPTQILKQWPHHSSSYLYYSHSTVLHSPNDQTLKTSKKHYHQIITTLTTSVTMSLTPRSSFPLFLLVLIPITVTAMDSSLHEVLHRHGLPAGLFPQSVKSFSLDQTGGLEVHLDEPCLAQYETSVFFDSVVRANLSFGQLKVLEGMSREELFLWLPVKDIIVTDPSLGLILIDIGLAYKHLSLSRFEDPPICRPPQGLSLNIGGRKGIGFI